MDSYASMRAKQANFAKLNILGPGRSERGELDDCAEKSSHFEKMIHLRKRAFETLKIQKL